MQLLKVRAHFTGLLKHAHWPRCLYIVLEGQGMGLLIHQFSPPLGFAFREVHFLHGGGVPAALVMAKCSSMALQKALRKRTERNWHVLQCGCPPAALTSGGQEACATDTKSAC